jgi:D-alanyl-lipoteichoic acid acyltransferase DltB (MBOAT superfamily)
MLFNTINYWIFFVVVAVLFYSMPFRAGKIFLLCASYFFYMCWDPRFIVLILASTVIDYVLGILLEQAEGRGRKLLLIVSLVVNLGILGFFKYYNFFAASFATLLRLPEDSFMLRIILPIGVSFYTFASLSYTIDVYWRKMKAVRNFVDYAFFIAFFPHLVAGPIIRAKQFLPQIANWQPPAGPTVQRGIVLVLCGLVKKMVFADRFAIASDDYFNNLGQHPGWLAAWSGAVAFSFQVYFDFSGYTDIARGSAKLLGFEFPLNFVRPYLAKNVTEFWQRWHITLSAWVRDYLFMPMVRRYRGRWWIYVSLVFIMTLIGLWHGARWTFVAWGGYFGVLLVTYRFYQVMSKHTSLERFMDKRWLTPFAVGLTFSCVTLGVAFFRPSSFAETSTVLRAMFDFQHASGVSVLTTGTIVLIFVSFVIAVIEERHRFIEQLPTARARYQIPAFFCVFLALELFSVPLKVPFIYFQF